MKLDKCGGARKNPLLSFSLTLNIKKPHRYNNLFNSERKAAKWPRRVPLIKLRLVSPCSSIQLTRIIPEQIRRNPHVYLTSATRRNCDSRRNRCCRKRTRQSKRCLFTSLADVVPARSVSVPSPSLSSDAARPLLPRPSSLGFRLCVDADAAVHTFTWPCSCII